MYISYRYMVIASFFTLLSVTIYNHLSISHPPHIPQEKRVEVETVRLQNIHEIASFIGTVRSRQQTVLTSKTQGILTIVSKPGHYVPKGTLIAYIRSEDIERNYRILEEAEAIAASQLSRANALMKSGALSRTLVEEKKTLLLEAQKKRSDANILLEDIKILAPFDGTVGLFKFREGSQITRGDVIVPFYNPRSLIVEFDVPLSVAKRINDGGYVFVNTKAYPLTHIQKMLDEDTHMCPAYVEIDSLHDVIGTTVDVQVVIQSKKSVITIPFEALFLHGGKPFVYCIKEGKAQITSVTCGIRDKSRIEITSGLNEGDFIVPWGHNRLYPDAAVIISSQDSCPLIHDSIP